MAVVEEAVVDFVVDAEVAAVVEAVLVEAEAAAVDSEGVEVAAEDRSAAVVDTTMDHQNMSRSLAISLMHARINWLSKQRWKKCPSSMHPSTPKTRPKWARWTKYLDRCVITTFLFN